jgi:hypothetical protein
MRRVRALLRRLGVALAGLLAAGLLLPAATKQWSDRASELTLKKELLAQVNEATTETVLAADCFARLCMPELAPLRTTDPDSDMGIADVDPELWNSALVAAARAYEEIPQQWTKSRAVVQGSMDAYFAGTEAARQWVAYAEAVDAYVGLPDIVCGDDDDPDLRALRTHLGTPDGFRWTDLSRAGLDPGCDHPVEVFEKAYTAAGQQVLAARERVTDAVIESRAAGYSDGLADFLRDLWPF